MNISNDKLEKACSNALEFIMKNRNPNSMWNDFITPAGESEDWPTGYIGYILSNLQNRDDNLVNILKEIGNKLIKNQGLDGGWGYHYGVPPDTDSTANCLLFLENIGISSDEIINNGIRFLIKHQTPNGGFSTYRNPRPILRYINFPANSSCDGWCSEHLCVTPMALNAIIKFNKNEFSENVNNAYKIICEKQTVNGSWPAYWWTEDYYSTYYCSKVLGYINKEEYNQRILKSCEWTSKNQNTDGGWVNSTVNISCPFYTALAVKTLLIVPDRFEVNIQNGIKYLIKSQKDDRSWIGFPKMRIPHPKDIDPSQPQSECEDHNRLFTTATVLSALDEYIKVSQTHTF